MTIYYITQDKDGKEISREPKGKGRAKKDFIEGEDGNFYKKDGYTPTAPTEDIIIVKREKRNDQPKEKKKSFAGQKIIFFDITGVLDQIGDEINSNCAKLLKDVAAKTDACLINIGIERCFENSRKSVDKQLNKLSVEFSHLDIEEDRLDKSIDMFLEKYKTPKYAIVCWDNFRFDQKKNIVVTQKLSKSNCDEIIKLLS